MPDVDRERKGEGEREWEREGQRGEEKDRKRQQAQQIETRKMFSNKIYLLQVPSIVIADCDGK